MRKLLALGVVAVLLSGCSSRLLNTTQILDQSGQAPLKTTPFNVTGAWTLVYSYDCSRQRSEGLRDLDRFDLFLYYSDDDSTAFEHPEFHARGAKGAQTVRYRRGGWYYLDVESPCDWRVQVIEAGSA